jgi:hydroxypyruvate isomerase
VLSALTGAGYQGLVAAEYRPTGDTVGGLGWVTA